MSGPVAALMGKAFKSPHIMFLGASLVGGCSYAVFFTGFNIFRSIDVDFNRNSELSPEEYVAPNDQRNLFIHNKAPYQNVDKELEQLRKELGPYKRSA